MSVFGNMRNDVGFYIAGVMRRAYCRRYTFTEETSIFDPKGYWTGLDYLVVDVTVLIPFWVKYADIDKYIDDADPSELYYV